MEVNKSSNENIVDKSNKVDNLQNEVNYLGEEYNKQFKKDIIKAFITGGIPFTILMVVIAKYAPMMTTGLSMTLFASGVTVVGLGSTCTLIWKSLKKSYKIYDELKAKEKELELEKDKQKEENELELSKRLEGFNFEKKYEELSKDEYVEGMKRYLIDLQNLAETNPELAREMANKAFVDQGLVEAGIIKEEQPKQLVKKPKKDNKGNN